MAFAAVVSAKAQDINSVLKSVEQNNMELKALLKGNEAADIENKSQNTLEDLSIEYSPFFQSETSGIASSELVITQGFDFPTLTERARKPDNCSVMCSTCNIRRHGATFWSMPRSSALTSSTTTNRNNCCRKDARTPMNCWPCSNSNSRTVTPHHLNLTNKARQDEP